MREKADGEWMRRQNRLLLVEALRRHGPMARTEIGRETGLSLATVTSITGDLIAEGLIAEVADGAHHARPGRPLQKLRLNAGAAAGLGVEVYFDALHFRLVSYDGSVMASATADPMPRTTKATAFGARLSRAAKAFVAANLPEGTRLAQAGVLVQGIADPRNGSIAWSPAFNARNIPVLPPLREALGVPASIANDSNLAAEALLTLESDRYGGSSCVVFLGNGVGMGLVLNGRVHLGPHGAAAEFGHMNHRPGGPLCRCGCRGCLEAYTADYGIHRAAMGLDPALPPGNAAVSSADMAAIAAKARRGNKVARAAFDQAGEALGYCLGRAISILDLDRVVLTGSGLDQWDLIEPPMRRALDASLPSGLAKDLPIDLWTETNASLMTRGLLSSILAQIDRRLVGQLIRGGAARQAEAAL